MDSNADITNEHVCEVCHQSFSSRNVLNRYMAKQTVVHKAAMRNEKNEVIYVRGVCTNEYKTQNIFYKHRSITGHGVNRSHQITDVP